MPPFRTLPLLDESVQPPSWNERMVAGEYAVQYSSFVGLPAASPSCTVFSSLAEAEAYAEEQIAQRPDLRCRIYDDRGYVGAPLFECSGSNYNGDKGISPRFRRWAGSVLFLGGLILTIMDWTYDFSLTWPATIGTRLLIPGLFLLFMEAMIVLSAKRGKAHTRRIE
jgi:hypothetical protein